MAYETFADYLAKKKREKQAAEKTVPGQSQQKSVPTIFEYLEQRRKGVPKQPILGLETPPLYPPPPPPADFGGFATAPPGPPAPLPTVSGPRLGAPPMPAPRPQAAPLPQVMPQAIAPAPAKPPSILDILEAPSNWLQEKVMGQAIPQVGETAVNLVSGTGETALSLPTGIAAWLSGLGTKLAMSAYEVTKGKKADFGKAQQAGNNISEWIIKNVAFSQPESPEGKFITEFISSPFSAAQEIAEKGIELIPGDKQTKELQKILAEVTIAILIPKLIKAGKATELKYWADRPTIAAKEAIAFIENQKEVPVEIKEIVRQIAPEAEIKNPLVKKPIARPAQIFGQPEPIRPVLAPQKPPILMPEAPAEVPVIEARKMGRPEKIALAPPPEEPVFRPGYAFRKHGVDYEVRGLGKEPSGKISYQVQNKRSGEVALLNAEELKGYIETPEPKAPERPAVPFKAGERVYDVSRKREYTYVGPDPSDVENLLIKNDKGVILSVYEPLIEPARIERPTPAPVMPPAEAPVPTKRIPYNELWKTPREKAIGLPIPRVDIKEQLFHPKEYAAGEAYHRLSNEHYIAVRDAIEAGKPVPPEVLAEYPDLAGKQVPAKITSQELLGDILEGKEGGFKPPAPERVEGAKSIEELRTNYDTAWAENKRQLDAMKTDLGHADVKELRRLVDERTLLEEVRGMLQKQELKTPPKMPAAEMPKAEQPMAKTLDAVLNDIDRELPIRKRKPIPVGLSIEKTTVPVGQKFTYLTPEVAESIKSARGLPKVGLGQRILDKAKESTTMFTRVYKTLPRKTEFAQAMMDFVRAEKQAKLARTKAGLTIEKIKTVLESPYESDAFDAKVLFDDIYESRERYRAEVMGRRAKVAEKGGELLPEILGGTEPEFNYGFEGLTDSVFDTEYSHLNKIAKENPRIAQALKYRDMVWDAIKKDYIAALEDVGLGDVAKERLTRSSYLRHQVLDFYSQRPETAGARQRLALRVREKSESFLKKRKIEGSLRPYNTQYSQAEFEVISKMLETTEKAKIVKQFGENYDKAPEVFEKAKKTGKIEMPAGHEVWSPSDYLLNPDRELVRAAFRKMADGEELTKRELKVIEQIDQGGRVMILPTEIVDTLRELTKPKAPQGFLEKVQTGWKVWTLLGPWRYTKYFLRNLSGDAESTFLGNKHGFLKVPEAVKDLHDHYAKKAEMSEKLKAYYSQGGTEAHALDYEISEWPKLKILEGRTTPIDRLKQIWGYMKMGQNLREATLRYANFIDYLDQLEKGNGTPKNFGASIPEEVMALRDNQTKAYKLANDLIGAYDEVSWAGQALRKNRFAPFWSFQETNIKRFARLMRNTANVNAPTGTKFLRSVGMVAQKSPFIAWRMAKLAGKAMVLNAALQAYNNLVHPKEEAELSKDNRTRPHLILGEKDGKTLYFNRLGVSQDFLEWFGFDGMPNQFVDFLMGRKSLKEVGEAIEQDIMGGKGLPEHVASNILNKFIQVTGPLSPKGIYELSVGKSLFPDIRHPKPIRDRLEYLFQTISLRDEYRALRGLPVAKEGYLKSIPKKLFWYEEDPLGAGYYDTLDEVRSFRAANRKKDDTYSPQDTRRTNLIYEIKNARRLGDDQAERRLTQKLGDELLLDDNFLKKIPAGDQGAFEMAVADKVRGYIRNMHPLDKITDTQLEPFLSGLSKQDVFALVRSLEYYYTVINTEDDMNERDQWILEQMKKKTETLK